MNILLVSQPARDGVLRHVSGLIDYLLAAGDRVHLAYSDWKASDQLPALVNRVHEAGGELLNLRARNAPQPGDLAALIRLHAFVKSISPDMIHAHSSKAGALVRGLGLLGLRTPILYTPHSYYRMHSPQRLTTRVFHVLERMFGSVGTTITTSGCESNFADQVIGVPFSRQVMCWNAVDFNSFFPTCQETRKTLRAQLGLPNSAKLLGSVGRFSLQKDPLSMYAAFAKVARKLPDVHLVHLGQGELEPKVDALIVSEGMASRCHRLPYMSDTAPFYRALDGFLLTSLYEGMSYAVLEALATNLPIVLTRAPGNNDFSARGFSHIYWCAPGCVHSISQAIESWREKLDRPSVPNHRVIANRLFSLQVCYQAIREVYRMHVSPGIRASDLIYA